MLKPICVKCERFYRPKKSGVYFIESMPKWAGAVPGSSDPEAWKPYKVWAGDLYHCLNCGHEIIVGVGRQEVAIQHMQSFKVWIENTGAKWLEVKDC